jgi:hypothetical protein
VTGSFIYRVASALRRCAIPLGMVTVELNIASEVLMRSHSLTVVVLLVNRARQQADIRKQL